MKKMLTFTLLMFFSVFLLAQNTGEIKGKIVDSKTKEILPGTTIYIDVMGKKMATIADVNGQFTLKPLNPGTYSLYFTFIGYDTVELSSVAVYPDKITFLDETYLTSGITLGKFEKKEYREKLIDPEKPSKIDISHAMLDEIPDNKSIAGIIRSFFTDIKVSNNGDELYFRGSRNGDAAYYVDGVKLMDNKLHVPGNSIGSMTVYTGGVPAKYGDFTGGVVVVETQSYFSWLNQKNAKSKDSK